MTREDIIRHVAEWFNVSPDYDDDGNEYYDLDSWDWTAGCSMNPGGKWMCLAEFVECMSELIGA